MVCKDLEEREKTGGLTIQECKDNLSGPATGPDPEERKKTGGPIIQQCEENLSGPAQTPQILPAKGLAPTSVRGQGPETPPPAPRRASRGTAGSKLAYLKDHHIKVIMAIVMAAVAGQEKEIVRYE